MKRILLSCSVLVVLGLMIIAGCGGGGGSGDGSTNVSSYSGNYGSNTTKEQYRLTVNTSDDVSYTGNVSYAYYGDSPRVHSYDATINGKFGESSGFTATNKVGSLFLDKTMSIELTKPTNPSLKYTTLGCRIRAFAPNDPYNRQGYDAVADLPRL